MQQVRVYQSVLRKPQLAKCFTLRQSTENKAGRETYLCFHPFNYNALTPPSPQTVPSGGFAGDVLATHFSGGLSPLLKGMQTSVSGAQAPVHSARSADLSEGHPNQLTRTAPRQAGVKGTANSCLGLPCKKAPGQGWLFSLVFQTPHFGLQGGVSPQLAPSLEAAFKDAADEQRH